MLRKFLDYQLSLTKEGQPLHKFRPLITAGDTFFYEAPCVTKKGPHIRDAVDLKRWMSIVVLSLIPVIFMAIWNTGLQKMVFAGGDYQLMQEYIAASSSFSDYFAFALKESRYLTILKYGALAFFPVMIISYAVGGLCEAFFACIRKHEIAEGFLVTGMLVPLVLPPTIPYWMVAVGVAAGVIIGKELFGGTGMNIVNPALTCRAFLFFSFPSKMSGDIWVGTNPTTIQKSLAKMNTESGLPPYDGFTQATKMALYNISDEVKKIHVDAIASNNFLNDISSKALLETQVQTWNSATGGSAVLGQMGAEQMQSFVTTATSEGGLGLASSQYQSAYDFAQLRYGVGLHSDGNCFFGNQIGCMGETSTFACLLGAMLLIYFGVGAWRTMVAMGIGAFLTALALQFFSETLAADGGAWSIARFTFPAYKHLILGGMAFGLVFMITDPVSHPAMNLGKWIFGLFVGFTAIFIRAINPAYPEGVMLAILLGNVFSPLIDHYCTLSFRRRARRVNA